MDATTQSPIRVLLIEDNPLDVLFVRRVLQQSEDAFQLEVTASLAGGLERIAQGGVDAILLDLILPDSKGLDTFSKLYEQAPGIPILVLTVTNDRELANQAVRGGAQDYLIKGESSRRLLVRAIQYGIERKKAQQVNRLMQFVLDRAADAVFWLDPAGRVLYANQAACHSLGYSQPELTAKHIFDFVPDMTPDKWAESWRQIKKRGTFTVQAQHRARDGQVFPVEVTGNYQRFDGNEYCCSYARDLRERQRLEDQMQQARDAEVLGQLAGGVAHDFNNLTMVIRGYGELLLGSLNPADRKYDQVQEILGAARKAATLTRQLLAYSRRLVLQPALLDLNQVVVAMKNKLSELVGSSIEVTVQTSSSPLPVRADPRPLEQILINLATNAREAIADAGRLTIETGEEELEEQMPGSTAKSPVPGRYARLTIHDTGKGMNQETCARVFEPFFTTKGRATNIGLGLSAVYGIVKQSGGYIRVESEPGQGSTFHICLPRAEQAEVGAPTPENRTDMDQMEARKVVA